MLSSWMPLLHRPMDDVCKKQVALRAKAGKIEMTKKTISKRTGKAQVILG